MRGLIFFGFPLHPSGKPSSERADHLAGVDVPLLFLQGTRDRLAELDRLEPIVAGFGRRGRLHVVDGGDHSFHVLKRSGRSDTEVMAELGETVENWVRALCAGSEGPHRREGGERSRGRGGPR